MAGEENHFDGLVLDEIKISCSGADREREQGKGTAEHQVNQDPTRCTSLDTTPSATQPKALRMVPARWVIAVILVLGTVSVLMLVIVMASLFARQPNVLMTELDQTTQSQLRIFSGIDTNSDGLLNASELKALYQDLQRSSYMPEETGWTACMSNASIGPGMLRYGSADPTAEFFLLADNDKSGTIEFSEFALLGTAKDCKAQGALQTETSGEHHGEDRTAVEKDQQLLRRWDGGFDADGSHGLDTFELAELLRFQGEGYMDEEEVAALLQEFDEDKDGQVSLAELSAARDDGLNGQVHLPGGEGRRIEAESEATVIELGACNGDMILCSRRFNEVAYATTHNSYNAQKSGFVYPNQIETMVTQLDDGIRGLMIDLHIDPGSQTLVLCHGGHIDILNSFCPGGKESAVEALMPIREWLEHHKRDVITFILEVNGPSKVQIQKMFDDAGFGGMLFDPDTEQISTWPTLGQMLDSGKRVVILAGGHAGRVLLRQTPWNYKSRAESGIIVHDETVSCSGACAALRRPSQDELDIHLLNHFITYPAARSFALQMNFNEVLSERIQRWRADHGRIPNFIAVDFYEIGHVLQAVDALNGVSPRAWACRRVGVTDFFKRYCCPGTGWGSGACGHTGTCNKASGQCSCNLGWERGFDCSKKICQQGSRCSKWGWCWNRVPGCCKWTSFTWWC